MNEQRRQALIRLVLPAAAILAVYIWLFGLPKMGEVRDAEGRLETARNQPSEADEALVAQRQLQLVVARKNDLTADERALLRRLGGDDGATPSGDAPPATQVVRQLTEMVTAHDLRVLEDGEVERGKANLPAYLKPHQAVTEKAKRSVRSSRVSSSNHDVQPAARLWRIEFSGAYGDVRRLLDALNDADLPAVPMSLDMAEAAAGSSTRRWTLLVWI